jgi:hypothetical protein
MSQKTPGTRLETLELSDFNETTWQIPRKSGPAVLVLMRGLW